MKQLLIITNSYDLTTDLLLDRLPGEGVFRLNFDQFGLYRVRVGESGFELTDPVGRTLTIRSTSKVYWRKPFNGPVPHAGEDSSSYVAAEYRYVLSEVVNSLWIGRKLVLVEPHAEQRTGKLIQLAQARRFFRVPTFEFLLNRESTLDYGVVKSLSNELLGEGVLYTTRVSPKDLSTRFPWFIEKEIQASEDITIVYVRGQLFSFSLRRDFLDKSPDWRRFVSPHQQWIRHMLPMNLQESVRAYMASLRLDYGRLDFLLDGGGDYCFCEVNPNGQFAWLDLADEHGLLSAIVDQISPETDVWPLSNRHPLDGSRETTTSTSATADARSDSARFSTPAHVSDSHKLPTSAPSRAELST